MNARVENFQSGGCGSTAATAAGNVLIVIPTMNEAGHIEGVVEGLRPFRQRAHEAGRRVCIVVVDGGSSDATRRIVIGNPLYEMDDLLLLDNPDRLQSAGVNIAVQRYGDIADWLIRIDAHSIYPHDYCDLLLEEAHATGADSIVVAMRTVGTTPFRRAVALAQNSRIGNGGSPHRVDAVGRFVDHGHHALMRVAAFRAVGGYDPTFSHNEDAELDVRLVAAGRKIWLTARTGLEYIPRGSLTPLLRQYRNFGRGRARTLTKHRICPRIRQCIVISVLPVVLLALFAPVHLLFALPVFLWLAACLGAGLFLAIGGHGWTGIVAGGIAGLTHLAWSWGFWQMLAHRAFAGTAKAKS